MIELEGVTKLYRTPAGPVHALDDVRLRVAEGEFVAVRGPSGCGKSTLLTIVGGLAAPTSGAVRVAGEDLVAISPAQRAAFRARHVGFVFQMFHLLPYLDVLHNVLAASLPSDPTARDRAHQTLARFGLAPRLTHKPGELSAGERQRVAMARALINRPRLLLADEPTGNLDAESAHEVLDLLAEYRAEGGTILLVTHQEQAAGYATRTVVLRQGRIETGDESSVPAEAQG